MGGGGGGGLNCETKAQVLVVMPPSLFLVEVGRKEGGRYGGAVRYKCRLNSFDIVVTHFRII